MSRPFRRFLSTIFIRLSVMIVIVALIGVPVARWLPDQLESWTGETDPRFQAVSLLSSLSEPVIDLADESPISPEVPPFGVNVFFEQEVEEWKVRQSLGLLRAAGVRWIRQEIPWSDIEVFRKGDFTNEYGSTWAKYDRFIQLANDYGIEIMARLDAPPSWSREDNRVHNRPPDDLNDYGDFVAEFVIRYRGKVRYVQIWNEPNIFPEWGWREVDAPAYAEMLKVAYRRIKAANPEITVVAAALGPTDGTPDGYNENDLIYLQKLYDAGAGDSFDVMSAMGYSPWTGPGDRRAEPDRVNFSRVQLIRDVMVRNGDARKPLWVAELGWNALPVSSDLRPTHGRVTREQQARYMVDAYQRAQREWPWLGVVFLWHLRLVHDENRNQVSYYFGLADADFALHPSYWAYQSLAARPPVIMPGRKSESHPAIGISSEWEWFQDGQADGYFLRAAEPDQLLAFSFHGTELFVRLKGGPGQGVVRARIDGQPTGTGDATIDLSRLPDGWSWVPIAGGLPEREYRFDLEVVRGPVQFDGLLVRRDTRGTGTIAVVLGVIASLLVGGVWMIGAYVVSRASRVSWSRLKYLRVERPRWRRRWVGVRLPAELYRELARDLPADRRLPFIAAAVAEALRRRRDGPDRVESPEVPIAEEVQR